jgi:hypothetical protein
MLEAVVLSPAGAGHRRVFLVRRREEAVDLMPAAPSGRATALSTQVTHDATCKRGATERESKRSIDDENLEARLAGAPCTA